MCSQSSNDALKQHVGNQDPYVHVTQVPAQGDGTSWPSTFVSGRRVMLYREALLCQLLQTCLHVGLKQTVNCKLDFYTVVMQWPFRRPSSWESWWHRWWPFRNASLSATAQLAAATTPRRGIARSWMQAVVHEELQHGEQAHQSRNRRKEFHFDFGVMSRARVHTASGKRDGHANGQSPGW